MYSFGVCFILNFCGKGSVSVPGLLPSENGFFLTVLRKTVVAYFFGVHLFLLALGKVAVTYQSLLHYSSSLKQVLKARILFHSLVPVCSCVAESNPKGVPSRPPWWQIGGVGSVSGYHLPKAKPL